MAQGIAEAQYARYLSFLGGLDGWKEFPVVQNVVQVMIVTGGSGAFVNDFEKESFG